MGLPRDRRRRPGGHALVTGHARCGKVSAAGAVTRSPGPVNRRAALVTPADEGRAALTGMTEARRAAAEELLVTPSATQRKTLRDLLAALDTPAC
ncbi:hypothetical protein AB4305_16270 [Nocardia sp. 2YAB30]